VALASWLVRARRISPFGALGRTLRAASDPLIRPIETRLVRAGGNPVHAGWWLVVAVAIVGVLLITLWNWLMETAFSVAAAYAAGPRASIVLAVDVVYRIIYVALWVRVLGAWFGHFRYSRWGTARLHADRLAGRADTPRAPASRRVRLEPAGRLAGAVGAEAVAAHHHRGVMETRT